MPKKEKKECDISNELKHVTFLKSFDTYRRNRLQAYRDSVTMTVFDWCFKRQEYPRTLSLGYLNGAAAQTRGFEPGPVECWGGRVVNGTGL